MRTFDSGATRDSDSTKWDYEAFLHPAVLESYAAYMHKNRVQADGNLRDGDNWQKGIPKDAYMKSMWRHFMSVWSRHRDPGKAADASTEDELNALLFNVMGYLYEELVRQGQATRPAGILQFNERFVPSASHLGNVNAFAGGAAVEEVSVPFIPGDRVRVVRRVDQEDGWNNGWSFYMDGALSATEPYVVERVSDSGMGVYLKGSPEVTGFGFPPSSLERVDG